MISVAWCPWCGGEIIPRSITKDDIEWENCKTRLCKGITLTLVSDYDGYVIHPNRIRNYYIQAKPRRVQLNKPRYRKRRRKRR